MLQIKQPKVDMRPFSLFFITLSLFLSEYLFCHIPVYFFTFLSILIYPSFQPSLLSFSPPLFPLFHTLNPSLPAQRSLQHQGPKLFTHADLLAGRLRVGSPKDIAARKMAASCL